MQIAFIGGGNMATAMISGLKERHGTRVQIQVADPNEDARKRLQSSFDVTVSASTAEAAAGADVIVLAIKPQVMPMVLADLSGAIEPGQLVLSIAAGITIGQIAAGLDSQQAIVRSMPNTPALIGAGISGMCASATCRPHHLEQAERVLQAAGKVVRIDDENLMDAVTAISGSGPAYFFLLAECLAQAGTKLGLPEDIARQLAEQTCSGAGAMLEQADEDAAELRRRVTSPGGTTQAALETFEQGGFAALVLAAAEAAERRGKELAGDKA